ncbi:TonB-dependent receptor [Methylopila jiangsuensis]|uniref:TonB-dependent receptor n=1 Tax=Methylopila jiangsuensis TaxID=586230 RepID=A0A9W6JKY6_9HYPH|nr:TonB-dependent siderophore receptor [Methylopila jiangsuensis]MDR6285187.1 iron complex outermembrane receptor protein [Methylopila jiangsuensis]GLK77423.1 TonB-dependent receptor [Methylopila jiangsuensis]
MRRRSALLAGSSLAVLTVTAVGAAWAQSPGDAIPLEEISVQGQGAAAERADGPVNGFVATRSATGAKTDLPLKETPQSISVVTQDQLRATGAQTPSEALRYVAGVQAERYASDARYDWIKIRGFDAPEYLDGMQMPKGLYSWPRYEPFGIERLEVLKGPASVLYGQTPPGGLLNFVSKKPLDEAQGEARLSTGSYGRLQGAFDVTGPANADGSVLYRMVGLGRLSDTIVDYTDNDRVFLAPSVSFKPSDDTKLTVLAHYIRDESKAVQFLPANGVLYDIPGYGKLPRSRFIGEPDYDDFKRREWAIGYEFEHRFQNDVTFRQKARYMSVDIDMPVVRNGFAVSADPRYVDRLAVRFDDKATGVTVDNQLSYDLRTGPVSHSLLAGFDYRDFDLDYVGKSALFGRPAGYPGFDVTDPTYGTPVPALGPQGSFRQTLKQSGLYAQDQIRFDRFVLLLSGRYDWVSNDTRNRLNHTSLDRDDEKFTWRAGLLYAFDNGIAPYVSYSTMFQPAAGFSSAAGSIGTGAGPDGKPYAPTTGDQIEVGVKYEIPGTRSLLTAAVYDITQKNVLVANALGGPQAQVGEVRMKGFEAEAKIGLAEGWDAVGAFTYADSEISRASVAGVAGNRFPQTPKYQASGFVTYALQSAPLQGLTLGGGVRYFGAHYGDQLNALRIPSNTLFDAMARYDFGARNPQLKGVSATITATNLFDKTYVSSCVDRNSCYWGAARTVIGTLSYRW